MNHKERKFRVLMTDPGSKPKGQRVLVDVIINKEGEVTLHLPPVASKKLHEHIRLNRQAVLSKFMQKPKPT